MVILTQPLFDTLQKDGLNGRLYKRVGKILCGVLLTLMNPLLAKDNPKQVAWASERLLKTAAAIEDYYYRAMACFFMMETMPHIENLNAEEKQAMKQFVLQGLQYAQRAMGQQKDPKAAQELQFWGEKANAIANQL